MSAETVICLVIDMVRSTTNGLAMSEPSFRAFNKVFVKHIHPYVRRFDLEEATLKFIGDGWLLQTSNIGKTRAVVALAKTLSEHFQSDMTRTLGRESQNIPPLRLAIYNGEDEWLEISPELLDERGQQKRAAVFDWVGDSARRAVRASQACGPNQLIVGGLVRDKIAREFTLSKVSIDKPDIRWEEELEVFVVGKLHADLITELESDPTNYAPYGAYLEYQSKPVAEKYYGKLGKAFIASEGQKKKTEVSALLGGDIARKSRMEQMLFYAPSNDSVTSLLKEAKRELGLNPDVYVFTKLISKSNSYDKAEDWFDKMVEANVRPNEVTFNTLISKSNSYDKAEDWFDKMVAANVRPDEIIAVSLTRWVTSIDEATRLIQKLQNGNVFHGEGVYTGIFSQLAQTGMYTAEDLLSWYGKQKFKHAKSLAGAIRAYHDKARLKDALRISLAFPFLDAARRVFRHSYQEAKCYFEEKLNESFEPYNATYALAFCHLENNNLAQAKEMFVRSRELATVEKRREDIDFQLSEIERRQR